MLDSDGNVITTNTYCAAVMSVARLGRLRALSAARLLFALAVSSRTATFVAGVCGTTSPQVLFGTGTTSIATTGCPGGSGAGTISTMAGTGVDSSSGDGGLATNATLSWPVYLAQGPDGTVYIVEEGKRLHRQNRSGYCNHFAHDRRLAVAFPCTSKYVVAPWSDSCLVGFVEGGVHACACAGNMDDATTGRRIRAVSPSGTISTFAGTGGANCPVLSGGYGPDVDIGQPAGASIYGDYMYVTSCDSTILKIQLSTKEVSVWSNSSELRSLIGITHDAAGDVVVASSGSNRCEFAACH